jgi:hypothetical protein
MTVWEETMSLRGMMDVVPSMFTVIGVLYWLHILLTKNGQKKVNGKKRYTKIDRILQLMFLNVTSIVCLLHIVMIGNVKFIQ